MPNDEAVFDDGSTVFVVTPEDDPPSGEYVDTHDVLDELTEEEEAAGDFLGQATDVDNDEDNGSQWGTVENPTVTAEEFRELG